MAIGNTNAVFKSKVLKQLAVKDARFPKLLRLVKALAREPGILGGRDGRLNSYCITQMVTPPHPTPPSNGLLNGFGQNKAWTAACA